jgi:hypothetical protein
MIRAIVAIVNTAAITEISQNRTLGGTRRWATITPAKTQVMIKSTNAVLVALRPYHMSQAMVPATMIMYTNAT